MKVKKIVIEMKDRELHLTVEEALELKRLLLALYPEPSIYIQPYWYPERTMYEFQYNDTITYDTSAGRMEIPCQKIGSAN